MMSHTAKLSYLVCICSHRSNKICIRTVCN